MDVRDPRALSVGTRDLFCLDGRTAIAGDAGSDNTGVALAVDGGCSAV